MFGARFWAGRQPLGCETAYPAPCETGSPDCAEEVQGLLRERIQQRIQVVLTDVIVLAHALATGSQSSCVK